MSCSFKLIAILIISLIPPTLAKTEEVFPYKHWERPVQVKPQNSEIKIYPADCGKCHPVQYKKWKVSLHSRSVSPGLLAQTGSDLKSVMKNTEFAFSCYFCHAPALEQSEVIQRNLLSGNKQKEDIQDNKNKNRIVKNPLFDKMFKFSGVSCAVCHLREGRVFGPPIRSEGYDINLKQGKNYHNFIVTSDFFEQSEFCAACHQLDTGYKLNGKVLVNTYREWKESIYGENNITCQNCHMPGREHLFRGIHDPEMVMKGIEINAEWNGKKAEIKITNSGTGHYFPTYVTPEVVVRGYLVNENNEMIPESLKEEFICRAVNIELTKEFFDTRIPPQKSFTFEYKPEQGCRPENCVLEVIVYPDRFYNKFYSALLKTEDVHYKKEQIQYAFEESYRSSYVLWRSRD